MRGRTRLILSLILVLLIALFVLLMLNKSSNLTQTLLGRWVHVTLAETETPVTTPETVLRLLPYDGEVLSVYANNYMPIDPHRPEDAAAVSSPITGAQVAVAKPYMAFYQQGSHSLKLYKDEKELCTMDAAFDVLSASVNDDGDVTVITEDSGHKSMIAVYRKDGTAVYRWHSGTQLATCAALSSRHDELAVCTLSLDGATPNATLYLFDLKKTEPVLKKDLGARIPTFLDFTEKNLIAVGFSDGISAFRRNGEEVYAIDCTGARLLSWDMTDPYAPRILVSEGGVDSVRFYDRDRLLGQYDAKGELHLLAARGNLAAVCELNRILLVDSHGRLLATAETTQEVHALAFSDNKTVVYAVGNAVHFLSVK